MKSVLFVFVVLALCSFVVAKINFPNVWNPKNGMNRKEKMLKVKDIRDDDDEKEFHPAELPCAYQVVYGKTTDDDGTAGIISVAGSYRAGVKYYFNGLWWENNSYFLRPDIKDNDDPDEVAEVTLDLSDVTQCEVQFVSPTYSFASSVLDELSSERNYVTMIRDQEWKDQKCNLYIYDEDTRFCVDDEKRLVGLEEFSTNYTFQYFTDVKIEDFVVPNTFTGCSEYQEVYQNPSPFPDCNHPSSSSSASSALSSSEVHEYFTPVLPCVFTTDFIIYKKQDEDKDVVSVGTISFAGMHEAMNVSMFDDEHTETSNMSFFIRSDIKDGGHPSYFAAVFMDNIEGNCTDTFITDPQLHPGLIILEHINNSLEYDRIETDESWNGVACDMYYFEDSYWFCVDADKHVIGWGNEEGNQTFAYRMEASESDFVVPANHADCSANPQFYQVPNPFPDCRVFEWNPKFKAADIPCAYTVDYKISSDDSVDEGTYSVFGMYQALTNSETRTTEIQRPDVNDTYLVARVTLNPDAGDCEVDFVDPDDKLEVPFEQKIRGLEGNLDSVLRDQEWDGIKCDIYYSDEGYFSWSFCADANGVVVGADLTEIAGVVLTLRYKGIPTANDFVVPSNYSGCSSYAELYKAPKSDPKCEFESSSDSSSSSSNSSSDSSSDHSSSDSDSPVSKVSPDSASTVKAIATVVLVMVLGTLITIF